MQIEVTEKNIVDYGLDTLTGNSRADLLARAEECEKAGYTLHVTIPDNHIAMNVFGRYESHPSPEEEVITVEQIFDEPQIDPKLIGICKYAKITDEQGDVYFCLVHNRTSKHDVDGYSNLPCMGLDPE